MKMEQFRRLTQLMKASPKEPTIVNNQGQECYWIFPHPEAEKKLRRLIAKQRSSTNKLRKSSNDA